MNYSTVTYLVTRYRCAECETEDSPFDHGYHDEKCSRCGSADMTRVERLEHRFEADEPPLPPIDWSAVKSRLPDAVQEALDRNARVYGQGDRTVAEPPTYQPGALTRRQAG